MIKSLLSVLLLATFAISTSSAETIRYPQAGDIFNDHHRYPLDLLSLALSKSNQSFELLPSKEFMNQGRAIKQLASQHDIDVMWTMTSHDREQQALPIRIPIYKGLIGWRLFLTHQNNPKLQNSVLDKDKLKTLVTIQGYDWPDTRILKSNGFQVDTGPDYQGLFKLLSLKRADLFPRSIIEIWDEIDTKKRPEIVIDQQVILSYPTASYFFVAPDNHELHLKIEAGLRLAIESGEFETLFQQHFGQAIEKAQLDKRRRFKLDNPLLPEKTPLGDKSLWFDIQ